MKIPLHFPEIRSFRKGAAACPAYILRPAPILLLLAIGWLTYGFSLRVPLFLDDMVHFRWLQWRDWTQILSSSRGLGYYRPLPFLIWKMLWALQGQLHASTLHAVNLGLHLLNSVLLWSVVREQSHKRGNILGTAASILFLLYPFSYQAVPWVGSMTHPLVTVLILSSIRLFQIGEMHPGKNWHTLSLLLAFLAPFAHETGILVAPLLSLLVLTSGHFPIKRLRETRFHWLAILPAVIVWLVVPKDVRPAPIWNLEARYQNGVYLLQGLAYPVAPLARYVLTTEWGLDDLQSTLVVSLPAVLLWGVLLWRSGGGRLLALAIGWFALAVAPAWLMLGFEYVIDGPRLLYLASCGAALFWAIPTALPWWERRLEKIGQVIAPVTALTIALQGYCFIWERAAMYDQLRRIVYQFVQSVREIPNPGTVLCVNCPEFLAPRRPTFAVGHEGVPLGLSHQLDDLFWVNTGEERSVEGLVLPDLQRPWKYHYAGAGEVHTLESVQEILRGVAGVILTDYEAEDITLYPVGMLEAGNEAPRTPFLADFAGVARLLSASVKKDGQALWITLEWQSLHPASEDVTVFVHLISPSGELVAQRDGYPLMGLSRPMAWRPGDVWRDMRVLRLPKDLPAGNYVLKIGLYPVAGGSRLEATDPQGDRLPEDAVTVQAGWLP